MDADARHRVLGTLNRTGNSSDPVVNVNQAPCIAGVAQAAMRGERPTTAGTAHCVHAGDLPARVDLQFGARNETADWASLASSYGDQPGRPGAGQVPVASCQFRPSGLSLKNGRLSSMYTHLFERLQLNDEKRFRHITQRGLQAHATIWGSAGPHQSGRPDFPCFDEHHHQGRATKGAA